MASALTDGPNEWGWHAPDAVPDVAVPYRPAGPYAPDYTPPAYTPPTFVQKMLTPAKKEWSYSHDYALGPTPLAPEDLMQKLRNDFGTVFPPVWTAFGEQTNAKLGIGQEYETRWWGLDGLFGTTLNGKVRVGNITSDGYTLIPLAGHPAYPGAVNFRFTKNNDVISLRVSGTSTAPIPTGNLDAYDLLSGVYWSTYAHNLEWKYMPPDAGQRAR